MSPGFSLSIKAEIGQLPRIAEFINESLSSSGIKEDIIFEVSLAVDEAASNTILYGYPSVPGIIDVSCEVENNQISVTLIDQGIPFNPLTIPTPNLDAGIDERDIGGLGIHFMRTVMDKLIYNSRDGKNILIMIKCL